jgi:hypothetical protein
LDTLHNLETMVEDRVPPRLRVAGVKGNAAYSRAIRTALLLSRRRGTLVSGPVSGVDDVARNATTSADVR